MTGKFEEIIEGLENGQLVEYNGEIYVYGEGEYTTDEAEIGYCGLWTIKDWVVCEGPVFYFTDDGEEDERIMDSTWEAIDPSDIEPRDCKIV